MFRLRNLDPRVKLLMMICISSYAMLIVNIFGLIVALTITGLILLLGGQDSHRFVRQAKMAIGMISFLLIIQCISIRTGESRLTFGNVTLITSDGLLTGLMLSLRLLILLLSALILLNGEPRDYLLAMVQCKIPYEIAFIVMVGIHFFPILKEEALNVYYSVQFRGTEIQKASILKKLEIYFKISMPILVCALEKARTMTIAMEARCFRVYPYRTYLRQLKLTKIDKIWLALFPTLTVAGIMWFRF